MADGWLESPLDLKGKRLWVAGHEGLVGSALLRRLKSEQCRILTAPRTLDLRDQARTLDWMRIHKPDMVIVAAAKVGGILANRDAPAQFLYDNLTISSNIIHSAYEVGVEKLLYLGSSCIYPKQAVQPIAEDALLSGPLEPTNEAYAIAKIAGLKLCETYRAQYGCDFIAAMPCNLYGPGDRFEAQSSHVIPAMILKMHEAKISAAPYLQFWGSGKPLREFMHVDDAADGLVYLLQNYAGAQHVNLGSGEEVSISVLARKIARVTGYEGRIMFDPDMPDGVMRKIMDSSHVLAHGWRPSITLDQGLEETYEWFVKHAGEQKNAA